MNEHLTKYDFEARRRIVIFVFVFLKYPDTRNYSVLMNQFMDSGQLQEVNLSQ